MFFDPYFDIVIVTVTAFAASALTALIGAGGGTALLLVMIFFVPASHVIAVHGCIQLVSNTSRVILFWRYMSWPIIWRFICLMPIGVYIGLQLVNLLAPTGIQLTIAIGILLTLFIKAPAASDHARYPKSIYYFVGLFIGAANVLVGVLSPLLGAILRLEPLNKEQRVGTLGFFGFAGNLYKIIGFSFIGFAFFEYLPLIISASIATIIGSILGKTLLGKISQGTYEHIFKIMLACLAVIIILKTQIT